MYVDNENKRIFAAKHSLKIWDIEGELINEIKLTKEDKRLPFPELIKKYFNIDISVKKEIKDIVQSSLNEYLKEQLNKNLINIVLKFVL